MLVSQRQLWWWGGRSFFCSTHRHLLSSDSISVYLLLPILWNLHKVCIIMPIMWVSWGSEQLNDLPEATLVPQSKSRGGLCPLWQVPGVLCSNQKGPPSRLWIPHTGAGRILIFWHCHAHILIFSGQVFVFFSLLFETSKKVTRIVWKFSSISKFSKCYYDVCSIFSVCVSLL